MPHESVEWVGLTEVIAAADRGLAPLGPELAGFVVLEAAVRIRDVGGGVIDAGSLVIDAVGQVHLTRPPRRADERKAASALRALLRAVLEVATGATPALRRCARTKDETGLGQLVRELEGALIPLNRAASRRGVARVARATLEAIEAGRIARDETSSPPPDAVSDSPPPARAQQTKHEPVRETMDETMHATTPTPVDADPPALASAASAGASPEPSPEPAPTTTVTLDETTPFAAPGQWIRPVGTPPPPVAALGSVAALAEQLEDALGDEPGAMFADDELEIVSSLPPMVGEVAPLRAALDDAPASAGSSMAGEEESPRDGFAVSLPTPAPSAPARTASRRRDRVDALVAGFRVSRLRDDPSLAYDLKAMVGIETSVPPQVGARTSHASHASFASFASMPGIEVAIETDGAPDRVDVETPLLPRVGDRSRRRARTALVTMTLVTAGLALGAAWRTPTMRTAVARWLAPAAPPPGDERSAPAANANTTANANTNTNTMPARLPNVCEAKLELLGVPAGAEVVRRLGASPLTVAAPAHVPLELIAVAGGATPRRAHVEASANWQPAPTGARLELPITLDVGAGNDAAWPARPAGWSAASTTGTSTSSGTSARGLLRVTTHPAGATLWLGVDPTAIAGLPCGAAVDLQVIVPPAAPRPVHVEWSAFAGSPPHATIKL